MYAEFNETSLIDVLQSLETQIVGTFFQINQMIPNNNGCISGCSVS